MLNKMCCLLMLLLYAGALYGQTDNYTIFQLRFLYDEAQFDKVTAQGQQLLNKAETFQPNQLLTIHRYMALAFYNLSQLDSSRAHFYSVLSIDADFALDPVKTSPKIIHFFEDVKQHFSELKAGDETIAVAFPQYIFMEDIRPKAALRSLVLPGWGQKLKAQDRKAYVLGGAFLATAIAAGGSYMLERQRRDAYLDETNPADIPALYDDYNSMSKTRRVFQYTAITIWALSLADALYTRYTPHLEADAETVALGVGIRF